MKNKIEIGVMILTLLASTACGSSGGQSPAENSATDPSASPPSDPQNQASIADLSTSMASIKNMSAIVGSYSQLSTDENNHLKGIAEASNKAWSNFESVLSQIQSGKSVSVPTPELMDKYGISNVTVDRKALDMWLKAFNDAQKKLQKGYSSLRNQLLTMA